MPYSTAEELKYDDGARTHKTDRATAEEEQQKKGSLSYEAKPNTLKYFHCIRSYCYGEVIEYNNVEDCHVKCVLTN
jgi:hypothetical protein